jgi:transposase
MGFREISDYEWELIRPEAGDRMVLNGILYVLTGGCRWCKYGSYKTAWRIRTYPQVNPVNLSFSIYVYG